MKRYPSPPPPLPSRHAHHTLTPKILICHYFEENNSMRDLCARNLVCNHHNLRLFDARRRIISHQRLGLFVRVWRAYGKRIYVYGIGACVCRVPVCAWRSPVSTRHDPRTYKNMFITLLPSYVLFV